ncbi:MBL fold metallo-hydrolase [Uliginosibacterium sp. sgz301328]|uniref:MBL fold metallo-hydrolase n=1 Tax=Uliginosibacterium sp. sgz301328 TaxID=3243764 RepID=UPI00359CF73B
MSTTCHKAFRTLLQVALPALMICASVTALPAAAQTTKPAQPVAQAGTQVPGYYRMQLGDFEVTALYDGFVVLDQKLMKGASAKDIQSLLARMFLSTTEGTQTAVNAYLVNTGTHLVLVDTGTAQCFGPNLGNIAANLKASGYTPEQVDLVLLTHLHPDHACGLLNADGKAAFPNAVVRASRVEADYWLSESIAAKAPADAQAFFKMARDAVAPYVTAGKFSTYSAGETLLPGLAIVPTPGHTPGHTSYLFQSKGQSILLWGDIIHNHAVQFAHPEVAFDFDVDSKTAIATRKRLLANVAKEKFWIGGAHLPFPGIGHVRADDQGYSWVPVEFTPMKAK